LGTVPKACRSTSSSRNSHLPKGANSRAFVTSLSRRTVRLEDSASRVSDADSPAHPKAHWFHNTEHSLGGQDDGPGLSNLDPKTPARETRRPIKALSGASRCLPRFILPPPKGQPSKPPPTAFFFTQSVGLIGIKASNTEAPKDPDAPSSEEPASPALGSRKPSSPRTCRH
jgi:hypothetical protein